MDSMSSMMRSSTMPLQEYLLQGSILENHRDVLLHRLNGLCDMVDTGPEKFFDHEMVYTLRGAPAVVPVILRVRHALDHPEDPWHVRYVGAAEYGDKSRHTLVRSCIDVGTSENIRTFLSEMGFGLDYEYVVRGHMFRKGRLKVTVSKLFKDTAGNRPTALVDVKSPSDQGVNAVNFGKMSTPGNTETTEPFSGSCLVELSVVAPFGQEQIQEDMKNFAEQLKPLVNLEKVDHRKLQQQPQAN